MSVQRETSHHRRLSCNPQPITKLTSDQDFLTMIEIGVNVVDRIGLAQDRYRRRALVNSVMNLRVP
jgi:hypothetical protein